MGLQSPGGYMSDGSEKWLYFGGGGICGAIVALLVALTSDVLDEYKVKPELPDGEPTEVEYQTCLTESEKWVRGLDSVLDGYHLVGSELGVLIHRQERYLSHLPLRIMHGFLLLRSDSGKTIRVPYHCYPFSNQSAYVDMPSGDKIKVLSKEELGKLAKEYIDDVDEWRKVIGEPKKI